MSAAYGALALNRLDAAWQALSSASRLWWDGGDVVTVGEPADYLSALQQSGQMEFDGQVMYALSLPIRQWAREAAQKCEVQDWDAIRGQREEWRRTHPKTRTATVPLTPLRDPEQEANNGDG